MISVSSRSIVRHRIRRFAMWAFLALTASALSPAAVWAQSASEEESSSSKSYVVNYILLILCVALGMIGICRMGKRTSQIPPRE